MVLHKDSVEYQHHIRLKLKMLQLFPTNHFLILLLILVIELNLSLHHRVFSQQIVRRVLPNQEELRIFNRSSDANIKINQFIGSGMIDRKSNDSLYKLIAKDVKRKIVYNSPIISSKDVFDKQREFKMNISYEQEFNNDPATRFVIMFNETTIFVTRSFNKFYYWEYGQTAVAAVIFGMIVVGNISILHRLKSCRRRRSNVNYFIVQLAIADLFVGFFSVTLDSILRLQKAFTYGPLACRASKYISVLFIYSSTYLLVALSIDRWEAVVKPLAFTQNRSRGYYLAAGAWILALVSAAPVTLRTNVKEMHGLTQCWVDYNELEWKLYMIYLTCSLLVIPALIIAICYTHIVYTIWSKGQLLIQQRNRRKQLSERSNSEKNNNERIRAANQASSAASSISEVVLAERVSSFDKSQLNATVNCNNGEQNGQMRVVSKVTIEEDDTSQDTADEFMSSAEETEGNLTDVEGENKLEMDKLVVVGAQERSELGKDIQANCKSHHHLRQPQANKNGTTNSTEPSLPLPQLTDLGNDEMGRVEIEELMKRGKGRRGEIKSVRKNYAAQQHGSSVIPKARIKTIKMTLVIVIAFVLCWSPFCIINLCSVFGLMKSDSTFAVALKTLSQSLAHLNSAVNPIIFWLFSSKRNYTSSATSSDTRACRRLQKRNTFWVQVKKILCCRWCCCCCCCFSRNGRITTDSRIFESTGTTSAHLDQLGVMKTI